MSDIDRDVLQYTRPAGRGRPHTLHRAGGKPMGDESRVCEPRFYGARLTKRKGRWKISCEIRIAPPFPFHLEAILFNSNDASMRVLIWFNDRPVTIVPVNWQNFGELVVPMIARPGDRFRFELRFSTKARKRAVVSLQGCQLLRMS